MPPLATFRVPARTDRLPTALFTPWRLSRLTVPDSARPARPAGTSLKTTLLPDGMSTLATLARSGTAPPQLSGSNQLLPSPLPVQVTDGRRVMLAVVLAVALMM